VTVLVGILCKDGVVVGSDSAATFSAGQFNTIEQPAKKVDIVGDRVIVATTGAGGLGQRFRAIVDDAFKKNLFGSQTPIEVGKMLCAAGIKDFTSTGLRIGGFGALVAFPCQKLPRLCEFASTDFQPELKDAGIWYVSMGSGQTIADPLLGLARQAFWDDGLPTCKDAKFVLTWIISQAIKLNAGGVNGPVQIAVLETVSGQLKASYVEAAEIEGHEDNAEGLIAHMRKYRDVIAGTDIAAAPEVPKPEAAGPTAAAPAAPEGKAA
jgi:hypothetical protein